MKLRSRKTYSFPPTRVSKKRRTLTGVISLPTDPMTCYFADLDSKRCMSNQRKRLKAENCENIVKLVLGGLSIPRVASVKGKIADRIRAFLARPDYADMDCGSFSAALSGVTAPIHPPIQWNLDKDGIVPIDGFVEALALKVGDAVATFRSYCAVTDHCEAVHALIYLGGGKFVSKLGKGDLRPVVSDIAMSIILYDSKFAARMRPDSRGA